MQQRAADETNARLRTENENNTRLLEKANIEIQQLKDEIMSIKLQWQAEQGADTDSWKTVKRSYSEAASCRCHQTSTQG